MNPMKQTNAAARRGKRSNPTTTTTRMYENCEEESVRPCKVARVATAAETPSTHDDDDDGEAGIFLHEQLRTLTRTWHHIPLSKFWTSNEVKHGVQELHCLFQRHVQQQEHEQSRNSTLPMEDLGIWVRVHGQLLHWLDICVTLSPPAPQSCGSVAIVQQEEEEEDIIAATDDDDIFQSKVLHLANAIGSCVSMLYRCYYCCGHAQISPYAPTNPMSRKISFISYESMLILIRALLLCFEPCHGDVDRVDDDSIKGLLCAIQQASNHVDTNTKECLFRRLPSLTQQRFILCMVEAATAIVACGRRSMGEDGRTAKASASLSAQAAVDTLRSWAENEMSGQTTSTPHDLTVWASIAIRSILTETKPNVRILPLVTISRDLSNQLFEMQCTLRLLHRKHYNGESAHWLLPVLSSLLEIVFHNHSDSPNFYNPIDCTIRHQAIDCLVVVARSHETMQLPDCLSIALRKGFLQVLTMENDSLGIRSPTTPHDHDNSACLIFKAVEGLQYVVKSNNSLQRFWEESFTPTACDEQGGHASVRLKSFVMSLLNVADCHNHNALCDRYEYDRMEPVLHDFKTKSAVMIASYEMLLSVLCLALDQNNENESHEEPILPPALTVSVCLSLLASWCSGTRISTAVASTACREHVIYLTVHTICHKERRSEFFELAQLYPELLSSLAQVLQCCSDFASPSTMQSILSFLYELLQVKPMLSPVLARQDNVVESITNVASSYRQLNHNNNSENSSSCQVRSMAVFLLHAMSSDVCNRRLLARHSRVLSSMVHFVREARIATHSPPPPPVGFLHSCRRELLKERILQLADLL